ncbi:hypothetical protein QFC20_006049 [Naganishia adeliensis]|uniref:Uncharacterized protein n=1 Tax=Naganishia adeliensis TaxID=92952 RepID=A0ACC2VF85_9TREE|nr:hypothetical protein QFC20_006049 [Naganishia adeliensis]
MTSPYPSSLSPGLAPVASPRGPPTPGSTIAPTDRPALSTRTGGSHLHPGSSRWATSTSRAGSVYNFGSVAATSVHLHQANPEEFEKALEDFVERQVPDLEELLMEVVYGIDHAFDSGHSPVVTERKFQQRESPRLFSNNTLILESVQATLQNLLTATRHTGVAGIPISSPKSEEGTAPASQLAKLTQLAAQTMDVDVFQ